MLCMAILNKALCPCLHVELFSSHVHWHMLQTKATHQEKTNGIKLLCVDQCMHACCSHVHGMVLPHAYVAWNAHFAASVWMAKSDDITCSVV
jgi:hypothetical protein